MISTEQSRPSCASLSPSPFSGVPGSFGSVSASSPSDSAVPEDEILGAKQTYAEGGWRLYDPNSTAAQDVKIAQLTQAALQLKDSLGETLPGDYLNVYAENLDTNDIVEFTRTQPEAFNAPQSSPRKGDETVPEHSASLGGRGGRLVEGNHTEIPEMTCVHNRIADYIRGD